MRQKLRLEDAGNQAVPHSPPPGTEIKIAIDLSRTKWVYCVRWGGQEQRRLTTPAALTHLQALVAQYPGCPVHLAFEACGFGYEIAWWAQAQAIAVTVIAPSRMERAPGLQVKTDRLDAGKMVRKLEQGELKGIDVPVRDGHEKRQVARTYGQALKERQRAQQRMRSLMQEHGRLGPLPTAGRFVLEIGDVHRFATADSIGHYLGLTPSEYSSGELLRRGPILKCGPGALRAAMLQCGWASVRTGGDATLRAMFERLVPRMGKKRAIVAVTRRLVVRLRARWQETVEEVAAAA
jgi:transposase